MWPLRGGASHGACFDLRLCVPVTRRAPSKVLVTLTSMICIMMSCAQAVQTKYVLTLEPTSHVPVHSKLESLQGLTGRVTLGSRLQDFKLLPVPCAAIMNHWQPLTGGLGISGTAVIVTVTYHWQGLTVVRLPVYASVTV